MTTSPVEPIVGHTAGPWRVHTFVAPGWTTPTTTILGPDDEYIVGSVHWLSNDGSIGQANARLIAAAPDLLAALKQLTSYCETTWCIDEEEDEPDPYLEASRAALTKAEGRDQ